MATDRDVKESAMLDRFGVLLAVVITTIVAMSLIDVYESFTRAALMHALSGAALLLAVRTAGVPRRWRQAADILVIFTFMSSVLYAVLGQVGVLTARPGEGPAIAWAVAALLVPVVITRRLFQHQVVSLATVLGAIVAYLQIAIGFAIALQSLDALTGTPIYGKVVPTTTYIYASLVTITTTGFGDVVPVTAASRLVTSTEAVIGQVFLVTFVAMIVGRFAVARTGDG